MNMRRIQPQRSLRDSLYRLADGASIVGTLAAITVWRTGFVGGEFQTAAAIALVGFFFVAEFTGLYRAWRGNAPEKEMLCALLTWAWTVLVLLAIGFVTRSSHVFPRSSILLWMAAAPATSLGYRLVVYWTQRTLRAQGFNARKFAIVGVNELGLQLARNIEESPELGLRVAGFYDDRPESRTPSVPDEVGQRIGRLDELVEQARSGEVDIIYITFPMRAEARIRNVLERLSDTTASVYIVPDFFVFELLHSRWTNIGGLPAVSVFENPFYGVDGILKRIVDVALASAALLLLALPMLVVSAAVKLTSRGPIFFRQKRYGLDGREIFVWKFRSMTACENGGQVRQATRNDSRLTPIGGFLRKSSLDELPQLFNVLEGSMSLVGPRPHASIHNEEYRKRIQGYMLRHKVKPGITGLAQVNGWRGETDTLDKMEKRVEFDHKYIREWSLWLDVQILFRTLFVVFSRQNAY